MPGTLITFEGIEGAGKSTQVGFLASRLREEGQKIVVTREPGGTHTGELIRNITHDKDNVELTAVAESYLMAASRAQIVREIIRPALIAGKIVIVDRFLDSSLAYQGYGRELGEEEIFMLNQLALDGVFPNLTILLDVGVDIGFARRNQSGKIDRLDLQQRDFYERVCKGYQKLAQEHSGRYFVVDSTKPIKEVQEKIWLKVNSILNVLTGR